MNKLFYTKITLIIITFINHLWLDINKLNLLSNPNTLQCICDKYNIDFDKLNALY